MFYQFIQFFIGFDSPYSIFFCGGTKAETCTSCCYQSLWAVIELLDMHFYIQITIVRQNLVKVCHTKCYQDQSLSFGTVTLWQRDNKVQSPLQTLVCNVTEPEMNVTYLTKTSFAFWSMSCESPVPSSAPKCFSTTCWSSLLRSRGILFASFDSKARAAERTNFRSGTSSTWNAKSHTFRDKWQSIKLKPQLGHFVWESYHVPAQTLNYWYF